MSTENTRRIKKIHVKVVRQNAEPKNTDNYEVHIIDEKNLVLVRTHLDFNVFDNQNDQYSFSEDFSYEGIAGRLEITMKEEDIVWRRVFMAKNKWIHILGERDDFYLAFTLPIEELPYEIARRSDMAIVKVSVQGEEKALTDLYELVLDSYCSEDDTKPEKTKHIVEQKKDGAGKKGQKKTTQVKKEKKEEVKKPKKKKLEETVSSTKPENKKAKNNNPPTKSEKKKAEKAVSSTKPNDSSGQKERLQKGLSTEIPAIDDKKKEELAVEEAAKVEELTPPQDNEVIDDSLQKLYEIDTSEFVVYIIDEQGEPNYYVIHKTPTLHEPRNHLLYYSTLQAREVMSAAFRPEREGRGKYANNEFEVSEIIYKNQAGEVPYTTLAKEILIRSGGGKNTSIISNNYKVIDLLLYSPKTERYEIIKATHDAANRTCFIDLAIFKVFVKHFGNPGLPYRIGDGAGGNPEDATLNPESVLKGFGYSVAQNVGLSDKQRQDILADVVDLGILSVSKVIWYLELFIRLHPGANFYLAREKWERDEYFIANYSENPERFYIK